MTLTSCLGKALEMRADAIVSWTQEGTDSYRVFHGAVEGRPGLTVDRYGPLTLAQVAGFHPLTASEQEQLESFLAELGGAPVLAARDGAKLTLLKECTSGVWSSTVWCREMGLDFAINLSKAHRDPQLFLDFRAAKRAMLGVLAELGEGASVLNLFAYTCSVSCHAAGAGASEVWSADFSSGNLGWGQKNFRRNRLSAGAGLFLEQDCIGLLWALTGNHKALSRRREFKTRLAPRQFDLVVVDPPAWSKGKFATVDLVRDPETVFAPAWEVVAPGGLLVAANNSAKVTRSEFGERLSRMLAKRSEAGECRSLTWVTPDQDFPSFDGEYPLKVALRRKV
jgi:23S rRNA (cytosine1962-C5)-methyltransferase